MNDLQLSGLVFQGRGPYSFQIQPASIVGLHGASGAGKTLLLRAIADLDPHQGQLRLGEMVCAQVSAARWRKTVGLLSAESFWWFDTVGEHFHVPMRELQGFLRKLGFSSEVLNWEVSRLSTGEKQSLAKPAGTGHQDNFTAALKPLDQLPGFINVVTVLLY
jgi:ATPase subunit of ABC transporter with duplicated ATPase domains